MRAYFFSKVLGASLASLHEFSEFLPRGRRPVDDPFAAEPLFPLWPGELEKRGSNSEAWSEENGDTAQQGEAKVGGMNLRRRISAKKTVIDNPEPRNTRASARQVLRWVEARLVPASISRPQTGKLPAGIELYGVSALGVGLIDGDRLVRVDGAPVTLRGQVVAAVLAARGREAVTMQAVLVRVTKKGVQEFTITVEQPYMKPPADSADQPEKGSSPVP